MGFLCPCIFSNRVYVQSGIHDAFLERFAERAAPMKVALGAEDGAGIGPLIDEAALV